MSVLEDDLRTAIVGGKALIVVGTGVSVAATRNSAVASWQGLLQNGVERCVNVISSLPPDWATRIRAEIASGDVDDLVSAAEKIERKLKDRGGEWSRWLRETIGALRIEDRAVLDALRALRSTVATCNYDSLLEDALALPAVTWCEQPHALSVARGDEPGVLHLHGYWRDADSVILGIRDYSRILRDDHAQGLQQALGLMRTLVFVGFGSGLADDNLGALLRWLRSVLPKAEHRHFRLARTGDAEAIQKQHEGDNIYVLPFGARHEDLAPFLRSLAPSSATTVEAMPAGGAVGASSIAAASRSLIVPAPSRSARIAPRPARCFGRDTEVATLVEALLAPAVTPVAILGPAGIGKSTISREAIHDVRIAARFGDRRWFVRCEGSADAEGMLSELARTVGIEPGAHLRDRLFAELERAPALVVLDNAETPWEADPEGTEAAMAEIASTSGMALVASIRGTTRPLGSAWREPILLHPLQRADARRVFLSIAGAKFEHDPQLDEPLLKELDGLPLAVELLAHLAESEPDLRGICERWTVKRTAILRRGRANDRLTNLEVSFELSIGGPRMTPDAKNLLRVLSLFPDGLTPRALAEFLPKEADSATVLRQVGLAYDAEGRLRMLTPLRAYVAKEHPPGAAYTDKAVNHFLELAKQGRLAGHEGGAEAVSRLAPEAANIEASIAIALKRRKPLLAIEAAIAFGEFIRFSGFGSNRVLDEAAQVADRTGNRTAEAKCIFESGFVLLDRSKHENAESRFKRSLALCRRIGNVLMEGNCIYSLGLLALRRTEHEAAKAQFHEALNLYRRTGDKLGQANCIADLGVISLERCEFEAAHTLYEEALSVYRGVPSPLGEANCLQHLGEIRLRCSEYNAARVLLEEALQLHHRIGSTLGESNCIFCLGLIALERSDLATAADDFRRALDKYRIVGDLIGQANCADGMGLIAIEISQYEEADRQLQLGLSLCRQVRSVTGQADLLARLAQLSIERFNDAQAHTRIHEASVSVRHRPRAPNANLI